MKLLSASISFIVVCIAFLQECKGSFIEEPQNVTVSVGQNHTVRCLFNGSGILSWKVNGTIYGNRDTIPFYSRMFLNNGQEITTSVELYLNGTTYQCILSQSNIEFNSDIGILLIVHDISTTISDTSSIKIWTTTKTTSDIWSEEVDNTILYNTTTSKNATGIMTPGSTGESKNYSHNISTEILSEISHNTKASFAVTLSLSGLVGVIVGYVVSGMMMLTIGVGIGFCCKIQKKKSKFKSEMTHEIHESKTEDKTPVYEEVLELKSQEKINLNKNMAYEKVSAH